MSIDTDHANTPANTATSLGSREECARINENDVLDADEGTAADTLAFDVTVTNIPEYNPMVLFYYVLGYDETLLTVQTANHNFLLAANPGSDLLNLSDPLPDSNGDNQWTGSVTDTGINGPTSESGSGVLSRLTISTDAGAAAGEYPLTLIEGVIIDPPSNTWPPDTINNAAIAVDVDCGAEPPPPTPTPTATPTPTPIPLIESVALDMDPAGNTATTLGTVDLCVGATPGSSFTVDVIVDDVPHEAPMIGFSYRLGYNPASLRVTAADHAFLLAADPDSQLLDVGDSVPDDDGNFQGSAIDYGVNSAESGPGILSRITFEAGARASGPVPLTLDNVGIVNIYGAGIGPLQTSGGLVVLPPSDCENPSATPTPKPTPTPTPTPCVACTPTPSPVPRPTPTPNPVSSPDAMSIDTDPANTPANTATSLGSREDCARINENDVLDADENAAADSLNVDVTLTNIPESNPMVDFYYLLGYDETLLTVQAADHSFLIAANPGSSLFNASDSVPDTNNDNRWTATVVDVGTGVPESGSGVLSRLIISTDSGAAAGEYPLTLIQGVIIDPPSDALPPEVFENATIAINQVCRGAPSTQSPTPPPPTPDPLAGGVLATFDVAGEQFRAWVTNGATIQQLFDLQAGSSNASIPSGWVIAGPGQGDHNLPWSWHMDPQNITMAEVTIELCDGLPSYVESNLADWLGMQYCPWGAQLVDLQVH